MRRKTKILRPLHCLAYPRQYMEDAVQEAIVQFWPYLFSRFDLVAPSMISGMENGWKPDLVAVHQSQPGKWEVLIVEIKGVPPHIAYRKSLAQVVEYTQMFQQVYPTVPAYSLLIGPYKKTTETINDCIVNVLPLGEIAELAIEYADGLFRWVTSSPFDINSKQIESSLIRSCLPTPS